MKNFKKIVRGTLVLGGLQFVLLGCLVGVDGGRGGRGRVDRDGGIWFHDGPWMDGGRGGREEIHPPRFRR